MSVVDNVAPTLSFTVFRREKGQLGMMNVTST